MSRSFGLLLYTLGARRSTASPPDWPERPTGRLIWMHAPVASSRRALCELARRLREDAGHSVLLTGPGEAPHQAGLLQTETPQDTAAAVRAFLDHWKPDLAVLSDGELRPVLLDEAHQRGVPMIMVDARSPYLPQDRSGVWPGLVRGTLSHFTRIVALDEGSARAFRRRGAPSGVIRVEGRMEDGSRVLPCTEAERASLDRVFRTRPIWLVAGLPEVEVAAVISAHRAALRLAHRLLVIIVPDNPARGDDLVRALTAAEGWRVARRSADEEPDEETEVFLADTLSEMGLWYRLAPITYLGGSLYGDGSQRDPFEAAALGSAILHGPRPGDFPGAFVRLTDARAARLVTTPAELAEGLADLLSPDRAARLAQGAWAVTSAGAEVTDRVVLLVQELLAVKA